MQDYEAFWPIEVYYNIWARRLESRRRRRHESKLNHVEAVNNLKVSRNIKVVLSSVAIQHHSYISEIVSGHIETFTTEKHY